MAKKISEVWQEAGASEELLIHIGINPTDDGKFIALIMGEDCGTNQIVYKVDTVEDVGKAVERYLAEDIK